jgi:hypothetical protein
MEQRWLIFCEESGDKAIPWKVGSSDFYVITAVLVRERHEQVLIDAINKFKYQILRMNKPLEWKKLETHKKRDDIMIAKFLRSLYLETPNFIISSVICNKHETNGPGLVDTKTFMNYLYGLMFKKISWFLKSTNSSAKLIIDRNTDAIAQESLRNYISDVARFSTGERPRFTKPKWINPEEHSILGLSDFISGVSLRALSDYHSNVIGACKICNRSLCIYDCPGSNFSYSRSFKYPVDWNFKEFVNWDWRGLIYHPFVFKDNYRHLFLPR